ncbi:hypothetical protein LS482_05645 [Sinomicrobium kalidii]|uniref:hypothetical protein n=1 Tax=Sinomicrobium kalidii TaxID=2900738 RepID=UPI001E49EEC9|nr:hypothetical protein [Sinomicrobium kalidii]UGU17354.1 hypothetical protein LS482_05645 [Sinomicrobium kalidii]
MEVLAHYIKEESKSKVVREKIENFKSSGGLNLHPDFPFYYTDGIKYAMSLFEEHKLFLDMAMRAFALSREDEFIVIRLCRGRNNDCWIEYCKRSRELLKKIRVPANVHVPVTPGFSMCFYFIGRTLLLPTEF